MDFLPFFIVLLASIFFSVVFNRFHLPWVLALITAGIVIGPSGFDVVPLSPTLEFLSQIGLIFLMFMAGLETKLDSFREFRREIAWLAGLNSIIPFAAGTGLGLLFGYAWIPSLLLGIIFMSSSIAVIIPTLERTGIIKSKVGREIVAATIIMDALSLIFLSVILQTVDPITVLPLPSFYVLLTFILIALGLGLPKIRDMIPRRRDETDLFESEVRIIMAMLIGVVVIFELLGLHPIIAGFFGGLVLSRSVTSDILIDKLRTLSYGIFIPVFFVVIGMNTDLGVFLESAETLGIVLAVVIGSMLAKYGSGYLGARFIGFQNEDAMTVGAATIPQLSTTLAVVYSAVELGLLGDELITAMVILSVITTLAAPTLLRAMHDKT